VDHGDVTLLAVALTLFVGSHFLLSHPLRAPMVARLGNGGFAGVYSLVAFATLGWAVWEWRRAPVDLWWTAPAWAWPLAAVVMLVACILFVGSVTAPNPALMGMPAPTGTERGVQRITRHPMMWAFALWAVVHGGLAGSGRTVLLAAAILILALVGARLQDGKKRGQMGAAWVAHEGATSFVPFGRGLVMPGWTALIGGIVLFVVATGVHPLAGGPNLWSMT
jgi:uncharacterized membrane protein